MLAQALATFEAVGAPQDALRALALLVETHETQGNDDQAATYREHAAEILEATPESVEKYDRAWVESHR